MSPMTPFALLIVALLIMAGVWLIMELVLAAREAVRRHRDDPW